MKQKQRSGKTNWKWGEFEVKLALDPFTLLLLQCVQVKKKKKMRGHKLFMSGKDHKESKAAKWWRGKHNEEYKNLQFWIWSRNDGTGASGWFTW